MADLILHHFDISPFAEKIRLVLGLKELEWHSVQIPIVMPKPNLTALTGGYRKTPVLQIGADIYCDTQLIAEEIERRFPDPTLYPDGGQGMAVALARWSDVTFFRPGAALSMGENEELPEAVLRDRRAFFDFLDFGRLKKDIPYFYTQIRACADLIERQLADGRTYLFGNRPGWADICAYFPIWMCRANVPAAPAVFGEFTALEAWEERVKAIDHGTRWEMDPSQALRIARDAEPDDRRHVDPADRLGYELGAMVTVTPDDYGRVPVTGSLARLDRREVAIHRADPKVGEVVVHFPRTGYRVELG